VRALADRFVENRRIRGDAGEAVFRYEALERAVANETAREIVESDALAERVQLDERIFHGRIIVAGPATLPQPAGRECARD